MWCLSDDCSTNSRRKLFREDPTSDEVEIQFIYNLTRNWATVNFSHILEYTSKACGYFLNNPNAEKFLGSWWDSWYNRNLLVLWYRVLILWSILQKRHYVLLHTDDDTLSTNSMFDFDRFWRIKIFLNWFVFVINIIND